MLLEQIVQVFPATIAYWLGFGIAPSKFVLLRKKLSMPISPIGENSEALTYEIHDEMWGFFDRRKELSANDERVSTDVSNQMLTMRRLWIIKGIFTGKRYKIGQRNWSVGFVK